jgi:hypothetical protein
MTVAYYIASFTDKDGKKFHGEILWDKYHQRQLRAYIAPNVTDSLVDYSIWEVKGGTSRAAMETLVTKLKANAKKLGLTFVEERETRFAPKAE